MKNKLNIWLICFLVIGVVLVSGCTQFQSGTSVDNTTSPESNLSSGSKEGPPIPESFPPEEEGPPIPP